MIKKLLKEEKGSAIMELAIIIPIFLLLVFGYIFYMNGVKDTLIMRTAAREAARVYANPLGDSLGNPINMNGIAIATAYRELSNNNLKGATVRAYADGYKRYVKIEKPYSLRFPMKNFIIKAGAVFYCEPVDE